MPARPTYTDPSTLQFGKTLAQKLIPVADRVRDLFTKFGMRPYKVRVVRVRWSSGQRGVGTPVIEAALDLLPTPLVQDLTTMTEIVQPIGLDEVGVISVSEISGRFTDAQLRVMKEDGQAPGPDEEVFYEIEFPKPDGSSDKRRFYLRAAPHYFAGKFYWQVRLEKAHADRQENGDLL
jgi:hypothetical protein